MASRIGRLIAATWVLAGTTWVLASAVLAGEEPDPADYRADVMKNPHFNKESGEGFCWHASFGAANFLDAYEAFGNVKWLEEAETYYDWFVSRLSKDPDGDEGWIGPTITETPEIQEDALVGDAVLCRHLASFAEIVLKDEALTKRFGEKARKYVDLCTRIIWEKWNRRGCYYQDAAGWGSYRTHGRSIDTRTGKWLERPGTIMSQPLNKSADVAMVLLRLWRIGGKPEYRERVERIFGRAKMLFLHHPAEDRVTWFYWNPHGPYDIEGRAPKHWVGVHSARYGYQASEVDMFIEVYDSGLVFEQADFERMIRTNRFMAHGGGKSGWRSSDGTSEAGGLWTSLARFDEGIRKKYEESLEKQSGAAAQIQRAYFKNVLSKHLGWQRRFVKDPSQVKAATPPLQAGQAITLALPIPDAVETVNNARIKLVSQTRGAGTLSVELLDAAGKEVLGKLASIETGKDAEYNAPRWDGLNPKTGKKEEGEYRVRWTLNGESRTERVWVRPGTKRAAAGAAPLAAGESLKVDFESALDARWYLEGATVSEEQAHGGKKSLKCIEGQSAVFRFGEDDDLPVKVSLWVFDNGKRLGKVGKTGGGCGVRNADGDRLAFRATWRPFLDGDSDYAWFNTGENVWYSPHPARLPRKDGWREWVFDFSNPDAPRVSMDGKPCGTLAAKFTPKGAVAAVVLGGSQEAGPVYVDDVTVEYIKK